MRVRAAISPAERAAPSSMPKRRTLSGIWKRMRGSRLRVSAVPPVTITGSGSFISRCSRRTPSPEPRRSGRLYQSNESATRIVRSPMRYGRRNAPTMAMHSPSRSARYAR